MEVAARKPLAGRTTVLRLGTDDRPQAGTGLARRRFRPARSRHTYDLAPRGVGQLLDTGCELLAQRFGPCIGVALLLWFPVLLVNSMLLRTGNDWVVMAWNITHPAVDFFVVVFACSLLAPLLQGSFVPTGRALANAVVRMPGLLVLSIVTSFAICLGCACILPGILFRWLFALVPAVYTLEKVSIFEALGRGVRLVATGDALLRWVGWAFIAAIITLPVSAMQAAAEIPDTRVVLEQFIGVGGLVFDLCYATVAAPLLALSSAFWGAMAAVFYVDQRVRMDGLDLEVQLKAFEARSRRGS